MPEPIRVLTFRVDNGINEQSVDEVERQTAFINGERLFLVLQSYGGDPASAVRIMKLLHSKFKRLEAIIPSRAMSAATLMSLGCDQIHLSPSSVIGPLDLQIPHPGDRTTISSLDIRDSFFSLAGFADNIAFQRMRTLLMDLQMNKADASKVAYESANNFVKPLLDQIDPYHLQSSLRSAQVGERYAVDLLMCRMMQGDLMKAQSTAKALAYDYTAHNFAITRQEASTALGLKVGNLESLKNWDLIQTLVHPVNPSISNNDAIYYKEVDDVSNKPTTSAE